eukprot:GHRQ01029991.1.p5 GENE.GHRQ01029991.1~~GHRQ01029991.1.p5  ORF type:complete len:114 (+),score=36.88 GHRQ01029991.1:1804-2145(+)
MRTNMHGLACVRASACLQAACIKLKDQHVFNALQLSNIPGKRYGTHPTSSEHYKGESQLKLSDADPESRKPWKTTNMVFQTSAQVTDVVGLANAGISSNIAKRMHKKQGIHSP